MAREFHAFGVAGAMPAHPTQADPVAPVVIDSFDNLLIQVSRELNRQGWALLCSEYRDIPYQYTIGLERTFSHPELEVVGLDPDLGQALLAALVDRIREGKLLKAGDFYSDLKPGYDFYVVENPIDPEGPPVTGGRLRLVWPDANHRFPWHPDCDPYGSTQSILLEDDGIDFEGLAELMAYGARVS